MTAAVTKLDVTVIGAGIFGLWQAFAFARAGHPVTLVEAMPEAASGGASRLAGAMLAPYCEAEAAEPIVESLGLDGLALWTAAYPGVTQRGSLVIAQARDTSELTRFARMTNGHHPVASDEIARLEPALAGRFARGLFYATEAHVVPDAARAFLMSELRRLGADLRFGTAVAEPASRAAGTGGLVIDCRGIATRAEVPTLRGVRGEMAVVRAPDVTLSRPVRLLHPRFPLYVVPWGEQRYMIGATVIERDDAGPVTLRSTLDLLGTAYAIDPAFGEAEVLELNAGVRPAFSDNIPKVIARGRRLIVNGAYRHGYLLAPVLAEAALRFAETGEQQDGLVLVDG
jgi:glycine oxidase